MGSKKFDPTDHMTYQHYGHCKHEFVDNEFGRCCKHKGCTVYKWVWDYYLMWVRTKGKFHYYFQLPVAEQQYVFMLTIDLKSAYKKYKKSKNPDEVLKIVEHILEHTVTP